MSNTNAKIVLDQIKQANRKAQRSLDEINKKMEELDFNYAKALIKDDVHLLKTARKILEKRK